MILETQQNETSDDVASVRTLVTDEQHNSPPKHLVKLFYASLFMSLLCFVFMLVDNIGTYPLKTIPTILGFVFLLPHHSASLLLLWLHRHQSESIAIKLPFTPYSPRVLAYAIFIIIMWGASTGMCAADLFLSARAWNLMCTYPTNGPTDGMIYPDCVPVKIPLDGYWIPLVSTITSSLEWILVTVITIICFVHGRRHKKVPETPPSSVPSQSQVKVISAC